MGDRKTIMWHQVEAEMLEHRIQMLKARFFESVFENLKAHLSVEDLAKYEAMKKEVAEHEAEYEKLAKEYQDEWIE